MPVVIVACPLVSDEQKSFFAEIEFGEDELEIKLKALAVAAEVFLRDAAFFADFKISKDNRAGADADVF